MKISVLHWVGRFAVRTGGGDIIARQRSTNQDRRRAGVEEASSVHDLFAVLVSVFILCFFPRPLGPDLADAVETAIVNKMMLEDTAYVSQAHHILSSRRDPDSQTVTVYLLATALRYRSTADGLEEYGGMSGVSTALTFRELPSGEYELVTYWEASDGSLFLPSIQETFPIFAQFRRICYPSGVLLTICQLNGWFHTLLAC